MQWCSGGGVFVSTPAPAYADGYVAPDGNIYYGYKSDSNYSKERFKIEVHYYSNKEDADKDDTSKQDPLGKFVHVKYTANLNSKDNSFDKWAFRPMWWYGVPAGLTNVHNVIYSRFEKYTKEGKPDTVPGTATPGLKKDSENTTKHYKDAKDWKSISRFYVDNPSTLTSKNGLAMLLGVDGKKNSGYDSKGGTTADNWSDFHEASKGMQGMFIDWESAGKRFYEMDYVAELTDDAWKNRDEHPLRFAAGVYRFAGNWHIATGQVHRAPKIADSLKVQYPPLTPVAKADALENAEKTSVENAIKKVNKDVKYFNELLDKIEVAKDGTATLTFHDKTTITMPGKLLVVEDKKDNVKFPPVYPAPMGVVNPQKLSDADQKAIIQGFKDANKDKDFLKKVKDKDAEAYTFDNNKQELTINYKDGSSLTIPYDQLVYQGAKISDWAPYVVPDTIEVENLKQLSDDDVTKIKNAFDTANADLDVYSNAKKKDSAGYLAIDKKTGNATIKWADGSTTVIDAWQFLKQKPKTAPSPEPQPPTPTPTAEKEFIVEAPQNQSSVNFDPFNVKDTDLTDPNNTQSLDSIKGKLKKCVAKDAKDNNTSVKITGVKFKIENGKGVVVFHADNYKDAKYPMSVFLKQKANTQTPQTPSTETKTYTDPDNQRITFKYKVTKIEYDGEKPTAQDATKALKQFVKDNYDNVTDGDLATVGDSVTVNTKWIPKTGTKNMGAYGAQAPNDGPMNSFSIVGNDFGIQVSGHQWMEDDGSDGDGDWSAYTEGTLFTIKPSDLYVKKGNTQQQKDNTIDDLKKQAKDLLNKRKNTDKLTNDDLKRAGISDPDQLNDAKIDEIAKGQTAEKDLRDLIRKLTDAKKAERKYNEPGVVEFDKGAKDDAKFKEAVKAFLKANYTNPEVVTDASITSPLTLPSTLTAKADTVYMGIDADGIKSLSKDASNNIVVTPSKGDAFTVKVTYKQKEDKPAPSAEDLKKFKEQAKEIIDRNPKLTDDQKKSYEQQIKDAKTKEEIQNILKEANKQAGKNNVNPGDIKKKENEEKEKKEKEQKEKDKKEREEKQKEQTTKDKKSANDTIDGLSDLTQDEKNKLKEKLNGKNGDATKPGAKTPEEVQQIVNEAQARNAAHKAIKDELPFLSHGKGESDNDDKALKELIGADPAKKDAALTALEAALAKKDPAAATAEEIKNALDAAKRQNAINEQNAKNAGIAKLDALLQKLEDAENGLTAEQKTAVSDAVAKAKTAINDAKTTVNKATKPSDIKTAVDKVSIKDAMDAINTQVTNAQNTNKQKQENENKDALANEKKEQIERINNSNLPESEKKKAIDDINAATKLGDPTGIADRALKAQKIKDALAAIEKFEHLNDAQKKAYEDIINTTDAGNHKDDQGKDTGVDDIDDALANAANTDNAMARLEELKKNAEALKGTEKYTGTNVDPTKKAAFDKVLQSVDDLLNKDKGDAKGAPEVNDLYTDLLNKMRDLDSNAQSAGLKTDALSKEIESDKKLKPNDQANPKTPGDSVYTTASKDKKKAFDDALTAAEQALKTAEDTKKPGAAAMDADAESKAQKAVDDALDKLVKARLALDGVNTKPLQDEINKDSNVTDSDKYKYATTTEKKTAFDKALKDAQDLIKNLTTPSADGTTPKYGKITLDTKENKQKALGEALKKLQDAVAALDGTKPIEPTPTPSVDKSHLQQGINGSGDVKKSDDYNNAPSDKKQAYDHALDHANEVNKDPNATQDQVNQAAEDLKKAENDLKPTPTPLPSPVPGGAGFGVNDNAPTTVDKGELNIQIDSAESDLQPGNAGNGNAGSNNAGNAANSGANAGNAASNNAGSNAANANAANGANSAAVNAAVESNQAVKQADAQVSKAQAALDAALAEAKKVAADPNATQAQVDAAARKLAAARKALAAAKAHAADVRASVRAQVLKSGKESKESASLSATGSNVSAFGLFAATISAAGAALFAAKRRGISRHSNK